MTDSGLLDTRIFIASESGRRIDTDQLPDQCYVSVITVAELELGVLAAASIDLRSRRMRTSAEVSRLRVLSANADAAAHWARLRMRLHEAKRSIGINDLWIAAIALAHELPVITQDKDFDVLAELGLVEVVLV